MFATSIGTPIDSRNLIRIYKNLLKKSNIEYRKFHSLRHTYATRLFEAGVHPKTVQKLMGHSDITTTLNIYTHVDEDVKFRAVDTLNEVLEI
ncbi:tyrosine-type recombinase/integrase [Clostridium butyricum]|uniref:tyrosine-type recombinase/integrase n=1 Tax=Clostridium butyricum TaxID=1492 RepID=UPI002FD9D78D